MEQSTFRRRPTHEVRVGGTMIGGTYPVVIQTMTNTPTLDTENTVRQIKSCVEAGAPIVRMTAQGVAHAKNLAKIRESLDREGVKVDLVADIHFNPDAAFEAALHVEKVRINPGNFIDPGRVFKHIDYTDEQYNDELRRLRDAFKPFLDLCREKGTAIRIGVNHGSLSDRIMSRYGDTPEGMVESAMEFLRVAVDNDFRDIVISIKASNVIVMTRTVRLLVDKMAEESMTFPLHLGVTEAGDGEDGRVKSAVGIGSLLADGIGDTIRVSLSESPEAEIPVARTILNHIDRIAAGESSVKITRHRSSVSETLELPYIAGLEGDRKAGKIATVTYPENWSQEDIIVAASIDLGRILLSDDTIDGIEIVAPSLDNETIYSLAKTILQATRRRITKTEFIACPGCGRTLFDLPGTLASVRNVTGHLKGLKIGVMGCIVNGPGEMADADYGYVGGAKDKVSVYRGKECVKKNLNPDEALVELVNIIKADGRWIDPPVSVEK